MPNRIADIRDPALFQRLVHTLFAEERGRAFQTVDDASGDRGNDGYDSEARWLLAIYCPEKDQKARRTLEKARADLAKAVKLRAEPGYLFDEWIFITPEALPERVQATIRGEAAEVGLSATFLSSVNLEPIYLRYPHLHGLFPELDYPKVQQELKAINEKLEHLVESPKPASSVGTEGKKAPAGEEVAAGRTEYVVDLFAGFRSDQLATIQAQLFAGDATARHRLEQYRLEAPSARERLVALMIEVEFEAERLNFPAVERLALE